MLARRGKAELFSCIRKELAQRNFARVQELILRGVQNFLGSISRSVLDHSSFVLADG